MLSLNQSHVWSRARALLCGQLLELGVQMASLGVHRDVVNASIVVMYLSLAQVVAEVHFGPDFVGWPLISLYFTIFGDGLPVDQGWLVLFVVLVETYRCILLLMMVSLGRGRLGLELLGCSFHHLGLELLALLALEVHGGNPGHVGCCRSWSRERS